MASGRIGKGGHARRRTNPFDFTINGANSYDSAWQSGWISHVQSILNNNQGFTKTAGKTLHFGDSMTVSQAYGYWMLYGPNLDGTGFNATDSATRTYLHADSVGIDNGWVLAGGAAVTAQSGGSWYDSWLDQL